MNGAVTESDIGTRWMITGGNIIRTSESIDAPLTDVVAADPAKHGGGGVSNKSIGGFATLPRVVLGKSATPNGTVSGFRGIATEL